MSNDPYVPEGAGGPSGSPLPQTQPVQPVGEGAPGQPFPAQGQPVAPPPGGYSYPPGYGQQPGSAPPAGYGAPPEAEKAGGKIGAGVLWGLVAVAAVALAVSLEEDGTNGWDNIGVWAGFGIAAAVATLVPAVRSNVNLDATRAWQVAVAGAVGLAAFWVLFVLPSIERNVSFLATVGCVAGGIAAWMAPGRPEPAQQRSDAGGPGQSW